MNNTTIINIFNSDNKNISSTKTYCQMMAAIAHKILKFESMIKKAIVANHALFTCITFSKMNSFGCVSSIVLQYNI